MSIFDVMPPAQGNLQEGGNTRGPNEPEISNVSKLSEAELAELERTEKVKAAELNALRETLSMIGWRADDVLQNKNAQNTIFEEINKKFPNLHFVFYRISEHLKTLVEERKKHFSLRHKKLGDN